MFSLISENVIVPLFTGLFCLLLEPLIQQASYDCEYNVNQYNEVPCSLMPTQEVSSPKELSQFRHIKERLPNPNYEVWVNINGGRSKIIQIKSINNVAPMGIGFQASINQGKHSEYELFHICRENPCQFKGTSLNKGAIFHHVQAVSIREICPEDPPVKQSTPDSAPSQISGSVVDEKKQSATTPVKAQKKQPPIQPHVSPRSVVLGYRLFFLAALITFVGLCAKTENLINDIELGAFLESKLEEGVAVALSNLIGFIIRCENGLMKGLISVFWGNRHWSTPYFLRFSIIAFLLWTLGLYRSSSSSFLFDKSELISSPTATTTPHTSQPHNDAIAAQPDIDKPKLIRSPSDIAFDSFGVICQARDLHLGAGSKLKRIGNIQCGDLATIQFIPLDTDLLASGVNCTSYRGPFHLCQFHYEVYMCIRQLEPCSTQNCLYGYSKLKGKNGF